MSSDEVLAVVVSYDGGAAIRETVDALRNQVGGVLIVDNGSGDETVTTLEGLAERGGVSVVLLGENRGVGHALNVGVEEARRQGKSWLLTMDQDSVVSGSMLCAFCAAVDREPDARCLAPTTSESESADSSPTRRGYAITSGNLVRLDVFDEVGLYDEGMFVDCVDFDFSLRLRAAGHRIVHVPEARMMHRVGHALAAPRLVRRFYTLHPPVRRYYMFRNYLYLAERHLRRFPLFIAKLGALQLVLLALMAVYDPRPMASYRAVWQGVRDYFRGVQGPAPGFTG